MLTQEQLNYLMEIERYVGLVRSSDVPCPQGGVIPVTGDLQTAIGAAPAGAILDLQAWIHVGAIVVDKPLTLRNGTIQAPPNCNDLVILRGSNINLKDLVLRGDGTTKRGIMNDATHVEIDAVEIRNIRRIGQETQALCMWNSPGPLRVTNSIFEAGSIGFLAGGSKPTIPNTIATDLHFENVTFTRPLEWRGQGYVCKNAFELKCAKDVVVLNCILENVWTEGQTGSGIVLTPVNYGGSPEATARNVRFEGCTIRNVGNGINGLGFGQQTEPTTRGGNWQFINNNWEISRARNGGQGALMMLGKEPNDIVWDGGTVITDGGAFIRMSEPTKAITGFSLRNMVIKTVGTYGVFTPSGSRGVGWEIAFPGGIIAENELYDAPSIFKTNFPNNTYMTA